MEKNKADLEDHLVCPICFEIPREEIFQCKNGHHICQGCLKPIAKCPQCRVSYGKQKIRNRAMESLMDAMEFDCPYKALGCSAKVPRKGLNGHEGFCKFKPIYICKVLGFACNFVAPNIPHLTIAHLKQCHKVTVCHGSKVQITHEHVKACLDHQGEELEMDFGAGQEYSKDFKWQPILWKLEEDDYSPTFLLLTRIRGAFFQPKLCSWICLYMGESVAEAAHYEVNFSVGNVFGNGQTSQLNWTTTPTPFKQGEHALKNYPFPIPFSFLTDHVRAAGTNDNRIRIHARISKGPKLTAKIDENESESSVHILPM